MFLPHQQNAQKFSKNTKKKKNHTNKTGILATKFNFGKATK